jgi:SAM-dependent methyltransferase
MSLRGWMRRVDPWYERGLRRCAVGRGVPKAVSHAGRRVPGRVGSCMARNVHQDRSDGAAQAVREGPEGDAGREWPGHHPLWRQRVCACIMAHGSGPYERFVAERKRRLFADLEGTILEIGAGTGVNVAFLPRDARYLAVEPNRYMHARLHAAASDRGISMELHATAIEALAVADGSVDAVICTLVLCSIEDPEAVVNRALRMLRPGGRFIFVEHVAAPRGTWLRAVQRGVRPVWRALGDGCRPDRETWRILESAGLERLSYERFRAPAPIVSPHIAGAGVKGASKG